MTLSANEETLRHENVRQRPSGFIFATDRHTAHGGTDLGARASKASSGIAVYRPCVGRWGVPALNHFVPKIT